MARCVQYLVDFKSVLFIIMNSCRYPTLMPYTSTHEQLQEEFDYQLMEIHDDVWKAALVIDNSKEEIQYHRMDIIWANLSSVCSPDGRPRFHMLGNVAKLVLVWPHSNAEEERLFSMVRKNITAFRPNLKCDRIWENRPYGIFGSTGTDGPLIKYARMRSSN